METNGIRTEEQSGRKRLPSSKDRGRKSNLKEEIGDFGGLLDGESEERLAISGRRKEFQVRRIWVWNENREGQRREAK